ncbi:MAG: hypothetical protein ISR57_05540 [Bacteroidales bacterium]|nr:hypothetical protein [Bacteroidota bacterium]MBL6950093.1 hypothetical protein [Bacteroidales bacterium]
MKIARYPILLLFALTISWSSFAQDPDSITVIPMAITSPDSVVAKKQPTTKLKIPRPDNFWRRISVGGNIGFQFGTVTGFTISPEVRIRTIDQLYVGLGFIYQYFRVNDYFYDNTDQEWVSYSTNTFGGRIFLRYYLNSLFDNWIGNFFAHAEYEYLYYIIPFIYDPLGRYQDYRGFRYSKGRDMLEIHSVFIGGGYHQLVTNRVFVDFLILFNLNDTPISPYTNPVFRLGVGVSL